MRLLWVLLLAAVLLAVGWESRRLGLMAVWGPVTEDDGRFIVIDSGHGFFDAGKMGVNGAEERTVNLAIAKKLRDDLVMQGYDVRMTREDDDVLYDGSRPTTKQEDMVKRVALMNDPNCILAISIHQNSFTEEKYKGAQVFYYNGSEESRRLAASIQQSMIQNLDPDNTRQEKANSDYYLLRKTTVPVVICECGFLSNYEEAGLLITDEYQEKTAWAIMLGIIQYINEE